MSELKMPHYRAEEDPFVAQRCFADRGDGTACLHLNTAHDDVECFHCGCTTFVHFADREVES